MNLPELLARPGMRSVRRRGSRAIFSIGVLLACFAALSPSFGATSAEVASTGADVVVCLDVSRSMLAKDLDPDRLSRAKREIASLAERARGDRVALVAFAGEARALVPLTNDLASFAAIAALADPASVGRGGTDLGAALEAALTLLSTRGPGPAAVVLLTDGEDLSGRGLVAAEKFRERGIPVHALGFGSVLGGKIATDSPGSGFLRDSTGRDVISVMDAASLRRIADATGGSFAVVGAEGTPLADLHARSILPAARSFAKVGGRPRRENRFQWPLAAALLCFVVGLARSARRFPIARPAAAAALLLFFLAGCDGGADDRAQVASEAREAFLRGSAAFARSVAAEAESARPGGDPTAMEAARALAEDALASWRFAAASRHDWPQARRNVERALLRIERLRERKRSADGQPPPPDTDRQPVKPPPPEPRPDDAPKGADPTIVTTELPADQVAKVFELLRERERQKQALRRQSWERGTTGAEKDW